MVLTESGAKTNIGHCCGERLFGSEWHALHRNAQRSTDVRRDLEAVLHAKRRMPEFNARVTALCDAAFGAKWLNQTLDRFAAKYPKTVMEQLYERAKRGDADIYAERQLTREEKDLQDIMADGRKPSRARNDADDEDEGDKDSLVQRFVRERQGALGGLTIFRDPIRDIVVGLRSALEELHQTDLKTINVQRLGKLARTSRGLEEVFLRIEDLCAAGRQFFQPENLKLLRFLSLSVAERHRVEDVKLNFHK